VRWFYKFWFDVLELIQPCVQDTPQNVMLNK